MPSTTYPRSAASKHPSKRGRAAGRQQPKARQRRNAGPDYWHRPESPLLLATDRFRVVVQRGDQRDEVVLDDEISAISWDDVTDALSGSITWSEYEHEFNKSNKARLAKQRPHTPPSLIPETGYGGISEGDLFILHWQPTAGARWKEVWQMRGWQPSLDPLLGQITMVLHNDLEYLARSHDHFLFGKSKKHPNGMSIQSIIQAVAKLYRFKLAKLPKLPHLIKSFSVHGSPIDAIQRCLLLEKNEGSGRKYFMRSTSKGLEILPLQRSRDMLVLGPALINATIQRSLGTQFVTALTVRGSLQNSRGTKSKKRHKLSILVSSPAAVRRFGYIHAEVTAPKWTTSVSAAREYGRKVLHSRFKPTVSVTLTHPGIPTLKRFDALTIRMPDEGVDLLAFATEVHHTVVPGDYSMSIVFRFTDPFVDKAAADRELKKCQAAQKRHRKLSASCSRLLRQHKKDLKSSQRSDKHA